jgi:hypothetical protein
MKHSFFLAALLGMVVAPPLRANIRIKIDTVPAEYTPYASEVHEPVSLDLTGLN